MKIAITCVVMCFIWIPYKMSDLSRGSSFMQDFGVAFVGYAIAGIIYKLVGENKDKNKGNEGVN